MTFRPPIDEVFDMEDVANVDLGVPNTPAPRPRAPAAIRPTRRPSRNTGVQPMPAYPSPFSFAAGQAAIGNARNAYQLGSMASGVNSMLQSENDSRVAQAIEARRMEHERMLKQMDHQALLARLQHERAMAESQMRKGMIAADKERGVVYDSRWYK